MGEFSWLARRPAAAGDLTHALFAAQSHSIVDNLVALFEHGRAWNCSNQEPALNDINRSLNGRSANTEHPLQSGPIRRRAGEPAVVISRWQAHPALVSLAADESLAGLALRLVPPPLSSRWRSRPRHCRCPTSHQSRCCPSPI